MDKEQELENGFNAGYIIEKSNPALAKHLLKGIEQMKNTYAEGFIAGSKECIKERELSKEKLADKSKGLSRLRDAFKRNQPRTIKKEDRNKDRDKNIDRDR